MAPQKRMARMRDAGVTPTMQRLAILEFLEGTKSHPTADEIYAEIQETCPTIARATVYNTLEALTKAGTILQLIVDPTAARYDADTGPHMHFRCRVCGQVYDIDAKESRCLGNEVDGHQVESVRTYAFGVCSSCHDGGRLPAESLSAKLKTTSRKPREEPGPENAPKSRSPNASDRTRGRRTHNAP
jgi:Fur family peroxide stress response transcriptional regulator